MKKLILGLLVFGLTTQFMFSQIIELSEVVVSVNYKYMNAIDNKETAVPVKMLQEKVALYDVKKSELYSDEYDTYQISFYIPDGKIVAAYDKDGKIIRTIEKIKNIKLPISVSKAILKRFPNWEIPKDVYRINYHNKSGITKNQYKIKLENGDKTMTVKIDEKGEFL